MDCNVKTIRHHLEEENFHPHSEKYSRQILTVRSKLTIPFSAYHPVCAIFVIGALKVIPQDCTANPLLRIKIT